MEEQLKQLAALFSKLPPEDQKRASELLKGVTPSNAPTSSGERMNLPATPATAGEKVNLSAPTNNPELQAKENTLRERLIDKTLRGLDDKKSSALEDRERAEAIIARRVEAAPRRMVTSGSQPNDPYEGKIRREVYKELGIADTLNENRSEFDLNRLDAKAAAIGKTRDEYETMPRLERMKLESAGAAAEQERRQGIRDSFALPISDNAAFADGFKQQGLPTPGNKRDIFKDKEGRVEDPATLKARLIKDGLSPDQATIAAAQRSRDMFNPPNAKKDGFGMEGGQRDAVLDAAPGRRMSVMEQLKDARKDNLESLAEARRDNPFRKEVGSVTKIEAPDGTVLAQRGEGEVSVARGGTAGAAGSTVDAPGRMNYLNGAANLKDALTTYNNADVAKRPNVPLYYEGTNEPVSVDGKQRFTTAPAPTKSLVTANPDTNTLTPVAGDPNISSKKGVELSGQGVGTKVTGAYGTAVGGISSGTPLTQDQKLGLAPLPPDVQKARDALVGGPTLPQGMEMKDGKLRAYEKDPIKEQLAKNQQDALDKAADEELKKRQTAKQRA